MTTSPSMCFFHDRQYASNIQHILNLLRRNVIKKKCDVNSLGKISLCTCKLSSDQMIITDEEFLSQQEEFDELKIHPWIVEIDQIIQSKIMKTCDSQISLYKLWELICEISNEKPFLKMIKTKRKKEKVHLLSARKRSRHSNSIRRCIQLSLPSNQIGHLLGRRGERHKKLMKKTNTRIHFDNLPYSISASSKRCPEFDLDLLQSSSPLKVTITGDTIEEIENATKALQQLSQVTERNVSRLSKK